VLHADHWKCRTQKLPKIAKNSPSGHHLMPLSGFVIATKARIDNRRKPVKQPYLLHMFLQLVKFGPLASEIHSRVWGTQQISTVFRLGSVTAQHSSSGRQPNFAALSRGRHLYLAGQLSHWALAHISSFNM